MVVGTAALAGIDLPHGQQHFQIFLPAPYKTGPSKAADVVDSTGYLDNLGHFTCGFNQHVLRRQSFVVILDT